MYAYAYIVSLLFEHGQNVDMFLHDNDVLNFKRKSFVTATKLIEEYVGMKKEKKRK